MPDTLNQQSAGSYARLIAFSWGSNTSNVAYYTSWPSPITAGGNTYISVVPDHPNIETRINVTPATQTGKAADEPWQVLMPAVPPLTYLARNSTFAIVRCVISEIDPTLSDPPVVMWSGDITDIWINPREDPRGVKAEVGGWRSRIIYPLGVESKSACSRVFGDSMCAFNLSGATQSVPIDSISGRIVVASTLAIPSGKPVNWFSFGTVEYDGLAISIIDGTGFPSLRLLQIPPPEWVGVTANFSPGCDKSFASCTQRANQDRFFGLGLQKPSDSPFIGPR